MPFNRRNIRELRRDQRGAVAMVAGLSMVAIVGVAALAVDGSSLYALRSQLQATADSAALAGASQLPSETDTATAAVLYAGKNMLAAKHGTVLVASDVVLGRWDEDARTFNGTGTPVNAVQVTTRRAGANGNPAELYFAKVLGFHEMDVNTAAVAWNGGRGDEFCILSLEPTDPGGVDVSGSAEVDLGECGIGVTSSHATKALDLPGTVDITAGSICVQGGAHLGGSVTLLPGPEILETGCTPPEDPLAGLPPPPVGPCDFGTDVTPYSFSGSGVPVDPLQPGVYCGGIEFPGSNLNVTFEPGIYIIGGGGMRFSGANNTYAGDGLMFYNTDSALHTFNDIDFTGGTVSFTAALTGPYAGVLYFQDPSPASAASGVKLTVSGAVVANLDGVIYFPDHLVRYSGSATLGNPCAPKIVSRFVDFNGAIAATFGGGEGCASDKVFIGEKFVQLVD